MSDTTTDNSTQTGDDQDLGAAGSQLSTAPVEDAPSPNLPALGVIGWARWFWRQLTSMRVALLLLLLLSLAAIPGSLIPQTGVDETRVADFRERHDVLAPVYDKLGLFHVYSSVWFSAIYILLFVSLIGCIVPRTWQFVGQLRGRPPGAPRRLTRLPAHTAWRTSATPEEVREAALALLKKRRFRAHTVGDAVAAEKGYLREFGNLAFHLALIVMLIAFAWGQLFKSEGNKIVVEGDGFSNTLTQYDDFKSGNLFTNDDLVPFSFDVKEFTGTYERTGPNRGTPRTYETEVTYTEGADGDEKHTVIKVNKPLKIGDAKVYLVSHGYAPVVTVRDGKGEIVYQDAVPLLPLDNNVTSNGVVKVLDGYRNPQGKKEQLGFQAFFVPTFGGSASGTMLSQFPALDYPVLALNAYHGDLKADSGIPQSVYQMDKTKMKEFKDADGQLLKKLLTPGETMKLPGGAGSITFEKDIKEWAGFQVVQEPGGGWALGGALTAIGGLAASLFVQRRRVWVRAVRGDDGVTVVEMAGLGRSESAKVPEELGDLAGVLYERAPGVADPEPDGTPEPDAAPPSEDPGASDASGTTTSTDTDSQAVPAEGAEQQ
ncbi:cytochrome c biogenesis protein ResB [Streptomyces cellulosae]|uniref:cytochrome c biogenesis protein ResB n=1 Tax=Streptomyces TaxID=1883 RepID=UPI0003621DFF|nr:cytochrome c biogenesis protein ResB [Streptomyces sp. McG7]MCX4478569.1 cytochrome c biogenesis protein ResB [Streptomyces cellulosae]MXQ59343.1 cytochrome c biogenesis protein ResB [Streptomyces sp. XHT-2]MYW55074.1 cytochrome c biogenesis protein ResB [Streptomyces sp. SID8376]THC56707.1 cytochrome c biogenesis protein ResB [Streptomyces sp. Akac8]